MGQKRLEQLARFLERDYDQAAKSLREGVAELFTLQRLNVPPSLWKCLATTNLVESPQSGVRKRMLRHLKSWTVQLRWQSLPAFEKLAHLLIRHLDGILNCCRAKVRFGVVEAINGNIKSLLRYGSGYKNLRYLHLTAWLPTKTEFVAFRKAA